ncbi:MAG: asparagine synthase (glutamine-hydrolyzing) [Candidatus Omnitrophota bacterium]|nr:asparagine synthase (glutamine-hydrolyzing) [Candidatus Omnitrophota bacterium]
MCGIAGIYQQNLGRKEKPEYLIRAMTDIMRHRGPDGDGYFYGDDIALGFRRLSIIDLNTGDQPIFNEDKSIVCFLNGEIYNYRELKKDLIDKGHRFYTSSDTEVLPHLYEEYQEQMFGCLNGMFVFVIWDVKKKKLLLVRDRFGIKPVYLYQEPAKLIFASEIKSIIAAGVEARVDELSRWLCFQFCYVPAPRTIFQGIQQLMPGHYLTACGSNIEIKKYYDVKTKSSPKDYKLQELLPSIHDLLSDSVKLRLIADVPVGVYLSSGIDSSLIAYYAAKFHPGIDTFSVKLEGNRFDETPLASIFAKRIGSNHHEMFLKKEDYFSLLPKLVWNSDQLILDPSYVNVYILSGFAAKYVKVVLAGIGGDELFAGYHKYFMDDRQKIFYRLPKAIRKIIFLSHGMLSMAKHRALSGYYDLIRSSLKTDIGMSWYYSMGLSYITPNILYSLFNKRLDYTAGENFYTKRWKDLFNGDAINTMMNMDLQGSLSDWLLLIQDRATMAHSIEGRVPFTDYRLVELACSIPSWTKSADYTLKKFLLRQKFGDILPEEILNAPKRGFSGPIQSWLNGSFASAFEKILDSDHYSLKPFNKNFLKYAFRRKDTDWTSSLYIYMIMTYCTWHQVFIAHKLNSIPTHKVEDLF